MPPPPHPLQHLYQPLEGVGGGVVAAAAVVEGGVEEGVVVVGLQVHTLTAAPALHLHLQQQLPPRLVHKLPPSPLQGGQEEVLPATEHPRVLPLLLSMTGSVW